MIKKIYLPFIATVLTILLLVQSPMIAIALAGIVLAGTAIICIVWLSWFGEILVDKIVAYLDSFKENI